MQLLAEASYHGMYLSILQGLILLAAVLGLLLGAYAVFIRYRQRTYTEKRFSFVALTACTCLVAMQLAVLANLSPWDTAFQILGMQSEKSSWIEKTLGSLLVLGFVYFVSTWAKTWNGQVTQAGFEARMRGQTFSLLANGIAEAQRLIARRPPDPIHSGRRSPLDALRLAPALESLPFFEQARELAHVAWPELVIDESGWIGSAHAWLGANDALSCKTLLVCCVDLTEWNIERIQQQVEHERRDGCACVVVVVFGREYDIPMAEMHLREAGLSASVLSFSELIHKSLPLAQYRRSIERQFCDQRLPNASFATADVFVPTQIRQLSVLGDGRISGTASKHQFDQFVVDWIAKHDMRQLALLGDYGQGKSTAALALTYRILFDKEFSELCGNRIPILIRLTGHSPKHQSAEEILSAWGGRYGISGRVLLALHRAGRTLIIFDAFDEMAGVADHADRIDHFSSLWRFACIEGKLIFTGRPNFFLDDEELKNALRIGEKVTAGSSCQAIRIQPFSPEQIWEALRWLPNGRRREFMEAVSSRQELLALAERPSLLFQVSHLWHLGLLDLKRGAVSSANVILDFVSYSIDRQIEKQAGDAVTGAQLARFIPLRRSELEYFMSGCAIAALSQGRNNSLSTTNFRDTISMLIERAPEDWFALSTQDDGSVGLPLSQRIPDLEKRIECCAHAVRTHGVLEFDPARADHYKFSHKSFAEALVARAIIAAALVERTPQATLWATSGNLEVLRQTIILVFTRDIALGLHERKPSESEYYARLLPGRGSTIKILLIWPVAMFAAESAGFSARLRFLIRETVGNMQRLKSYTLTYTTDLFRKSGSDPLTRNQVAKFLLAALSTLASMSAGIFILLTLESNGWAGPFLSVLELFGVDRSALPDSIERAGIEVTAILMVNAIAIFGLIAAVRTPNPLLILPLVYARVIARPGTFNLLEDEKTQHSPAVVRGFPTSFVSSIVLAALTLNALSNNEDKNADDIR